eukprot:COSAG02_NODE_1333_length_13206_cov_221.257801_6_plen_56_part_00
MSRSVNPRLTIIQSQFTVLLQTMGVFWVWLEVDLAVKRTTLRSRLGNAIIPTRFD